MASFRCGEIVRVVESERDSDQIYMVKNLKKTRSGGILYLLKSLEEEPVMRLYYETNESLLERIS
jgi:hypothetical protein